MPHHFSEHGAALVETAIVLPLLVVLAFGGMEFGLLYSHTNDLADGARNATRAATASGVVPNSDYRIIQTLLADSSLMNKGTVDTVIIYRADSADGSVPNACFNTAVPSKCNRYVGADLKKTEAEFAAMQANFPPANRQSAVGSTPVYVGVYVAAKHNWISGMFPWAPKSVKSRAVMRMEQMSSPSSSSAYALPNPTPPPPGASQGIYTGGGDAIEPGVGGNV